MNKEAQKFHAEMQAHFRANANTEEKAEAIQGFTFESDPRSERMVTGVKPTTVYEAPRPRRRRRAN